MTIIFSLFPRRRSEEPILLEPLEAPLARIGCTGVISKSDRSPICGLYLQLSQRPSLISHDIERHAQPIGLRGSTTSKRQPARMECQRSSFGILEKMGAPLPLKRSTHRRTIIIEGHRGLQEEIVVIEGIAGMNVGKGLVHIAHLSAVLVLQRAVVQR